MAKSLLPRAAVPRLLPCFLLFLAHAPLRAQSPEPDIVLTPNRGPTTIQNNGSAVTVIRSEAIERAHPGSLADVLRALPGVSVTETGGPGSTSSVTLRGASVGQTLVLVDGVRVNDPSSTASEFDFGLFSPGEIERIEILRGPQSALYGSDAMGGVIHIVTRKGNAALRRSVSIEAGSYGTLATRAGMSGATGPWNYALSFTGYRSDGFSRYGHRIGRIASTGVALEADKTEKVGGSIRLGYRPNADFSIDTALTHHWSFAQFDSSFGDDPSNKGTQRLTQAQSQARLVTLDGRLTHALRIFANRTERRYAFSFGTAFDYVGDRLGAEYQGDLRLGRFGTLILGGRYEREQLVAFSEPLPSGSGTRTKTDDARIGTLSAFALHQIRPTERLDLSFGGRIDALEGSSTCLTWRGTAAYRSPETGTTLRASLGTGAKAPTLYQLYSIYGTRSLEPETNLGGDIGLDQSLLDGRLRLGITAFANRFRNLIDFGLSPICAPAQVFGCYFNTARARSKGVEAEAELDLSEYRLKARASYTFLNAEDARTGAQLVRKPMHQGRIGFDWRASDKLTLSPSLLLVGPRKDTDFDAFFNQIRVRLAPHARLDFHVNYAFSAMFSGYLRFENLNGARIEEVRNYGSTGRAAYAGLRATW